MTAGRASETHVWAPGFGEFGGGIAAFSRELARALPGSVRLYGKHDREATWEGLPLRGAGRVPGKLRSAVFAARLLSGLMRRSPGRVIATHLNFARSPVFLGFPTAWLCMESSSRSEPRDRAWKRCRTRIRWLR